MTTSFTNFVESLPLFWKLATFRLGLYLIVVGHGAWLAGIEGYNSIEDMTPLQVSKLHWNIVVSLVTTIIAFLDSGIQTIQKAPGALSPEDIKKILADMGSNHQTGAVVMTEKTAIAQTQSVETTKP